MTDLILADTATGKKLPARMTRRAALVGAAGVVLGAVAAPAIAAPAPQPAKDAQLTRLLKQLERLPESHQHAFADVVEVVAGKSDAILSPIALDIAQNMYRAWVKEGKPDSLRLNFARLDEVIAATIRHMAANYRGTDAELLKGRELFFGGTQA